jgi:hypothetical protein
MGLDYEDFRRTDVGLASAQRRSLKERWLIRKSRWLKWLDVTWTLAVWVYLDIKIWPVAGDDPKGRLLKLVFIMSFPLAVCKLHEAFRRPRP